MSISKKLSAAAAFAAALTLCVAPVAAHAATANAWGGWATVGAADGTITFDSGQVNATWAITAGAPDLTVKTADEEWLNEGTPIGTAFGANGTSATNTYLKVGIEPSANSVDGTATLVVTFAKEVPAGDLAIAVSDIDSDDVVIEASNSAGSLTADQLRGTAAGTFSALGFNFCTASTNTPTVCSGDTAVPAVSNTANEVKFGDTADSNSWNTTGASAWLRPSAAVSSITFVMHNPDVNTSSQRFWLAQSPVEETTPTETPTTTDTKSNLAETGSVSLPLALTGFGLLAVGAIALATDPRMRRRR